MSDGSLYWILDNPHNKLFQHHTWYVYSHISVMAFNVSAFSTTSPNSAGLVQRKPPLVSGHDTSDDWIPKKYPHLSTPDCYVERK